MVKESWFQTGLSDELESLQQNIRRMHDHELKLCRAAYGQIGFDGKPSPRGGEHAFSRLDPPRHVVALGEPLSIKPGFNVLSLGNYNHYRPGNRTPPKIGHPLSRQGSDLHPSLHQILGNMTPRSQGFASPRTNASPRSITAIEKVEEASTSSTKESALIALKSNLGKSLADANNKGPHKPNHAPDAASKLHHLSPMHPKGDSLEADPALLPKGNIDDTASVSSPSVNAELSVPKASLTHPLSSQRRTQRPSVFSVDFSVFKQNLAESDSPTRNATSSSFSRSRTLDKLIKEADAAGASADSEMYFSGLPSRRTHKTFLDTFRDWYTRHHDATYEEASIAVVDLIMGAVILLNCVLIGARMDNPEWGGWDIVEYVFTALFVFEILLKIRLIGCRELFLGKMWAWTFLDVVLIAFAILDLVVHIGRSLTIFRVVRLGRILRLVRLARMAAVKELVMLIRGFAGGAKCLCWCLAALALPVYLIGIVLSHFLRDYEDEELFSSVPFAMFTTIRCMCGECTDREGFPIMLRLAISQGWYVAVLYSLFILISIFGVFNLITAIFIEGTMQIARSDTELQRQLRQANDRKFAKNIKKFVYIFWRARNNLCDERNLRITSGSAFEQFCITDAMDLEISQQLYEELASNPAVRDIMDDMGLKDDDIVDLFQMLDVDESGTLDVNELVCGIHKLRGEASKRDLVALAYMIYAIQDTVRSLVTDVSRLSEQHRQYDTVASMTTQSSPVCADSSLTSKGNHTPEHTRAMV